MPASAAEPNDSTSNWTCCNACPSKRAEPCWRKVASMPSPPSYGRFPLWGRFALAVAVALIQTPHRFRTKRQLWAYSGLALETRTSAKYRYVKGQLGRMLVRQKWDPKDALRGVQQSS